jgi:hypothetical protein
VHTRVIHRSIWIHHVLASPISLTAISVLSTRLLHWLPDHIIPFRATCLSHLPRLYNYNYTWRRVQVMKLLVVGVLWNSLSALLALIQIFSWTPCIWILGPFVSPYQTRSVKPVQKCGQIIYLYSISYVFETTDEKAKLFAVRINKRCPNSIANFFAMLQKSLCSELRRKTHQTRLCLKHLKHLFCREE